MANQIDIIDEIDSTEIFSSIKHSIPEQCVIDLGIDKNQFSIVHQNIRSIQKNFDNFTLFLTRLNFLPDIIILSECRLSDTTPKVHLQGYVCHYSQNYLNQNDGLAILHKNDLVVTITEPPFKDANYLLISTNTELTICAIYRSPSIFNIRNFCDSLDTILQTCTTSTVAIIGDINIDIKIGTEDKRAGEYLDVTSHHGFYPGHQFPTRERNCLDHAIFKTNKVTKTVICETGLTDHDTVLVSVSMDTSKLLSSIRQSKYKTTIDYASVISDVENADWSTIMNHYDVNEATNELTTNLQEIVTRHTKKEIVRNSKSIRRPWMTANLLKCVRKRDALHSETRKKDNIDNHTLHQQYKAYRNTCNNIIQNLKIAHEKHLLDSSKGNSKNTWAALKYICNLNNKTLSNMALLTANPDPVVALDVANNFFANIGEQLAKDNLLRLKNSETDLAKLIKTAGNMDASPINSFFMNPTNEMEVKAVLSSLKNDSAPGWDGISNRVLKLAQHCLAAPIAHICNLSMFNGKVPTQMKIANVCPIHKGGDATTVSNYRPISLLTSLSKILEKLVNRRLLTYLEDMKLLSTNQYGFRKGRSTEDAVTNLVDFVVGQLDKGLRCGGVFLDLAKAFDTVSKPILFKKMEHIGIRGTALDWFILYLTERKQRICVGDLQSSLASVGYGVPQGSVLGPTLFLLYVNGLCSLDLNNAQIFAYADDTAVIFYGKSWEEVYRAAECGMMTISKWLQYNLLTLNVAKTKIVNFSINKKSSAPSELSLKFHSCDFYPGCTCNCPTFDQIECIKYLGINIDKHLTWSRHIDSLNTRVRKLLYIFRKLRSIADHHTLKTTYYALCQAILGYCVVAWGSAGKSILITAERAQRAILKTSFKKKLRYATDALYRDTGMLTVRQLYIRAVILRFHSTAPTSMVQDQRSRRLPKWDKTFCHRVFGHKAYSYMGPHLYSKANKHLNLFFMTKFSCKKLVTEWLQGLNYNETEHVISIF